MKTIISKSAVKANVKTYILNSIDSSGHGIICDTTKDKLQFVFDTFQSEYNNPWNQKAFPNVQLRLREWLCGLPSCVNIDFEDYAIIETAKKIGSIPLDCTEKEEEKIINNWFNFIAFNIIQLSRKEGINY